MDNTYKVRHFDPVQVRRLRRTGITGPKYIYLAEDNFSLKKLAKGVVSVVKDTTKLAVSPVKQVVSSVTGKPSTTTYDTKLGGIVGKINDTQSRAQNIAAKSFADTVTFGYATKAANLLRKEPYKETKYGYSEMNNTPDSGFKPIDKLAAAMPKGAATVGAAIGAYSLASGIKTAAGKLGGVAGKAAGSAGFNVNQDKLTQGIGKQLTNLAGNISASTDRKPQSQLGNGVPSKNISSPYIPTAPENLPKTETIKEIEKKIEKLEQIKTPSESSVSFGTTGYIIGGVILLVLVLILTR